MYIYIYFLLIHTKTKRKTSKSVCAFFPKLNLCAFFSSLRLKKRKKEKKNQERGFSILVENHDISYGHVSIMDLNARIVIKEYVEQQKLL